MSGKSRDGRMSVFTNQNIDKCLSYLHLFVLQRCTAVHLYGINASHSFTASTSTWFSAVVWVETRI